MGDSTKKILITGAAGTLGRYLLAELSQHSYDVRATDQIEDPDAPFPVHVVNLLDLPSVRKLMQEIDGVIHLANHAYQKENEITFNENVTMNMNVFQAAADAGVPKVLFASSVQVIGSEGGDVTIDRYPRSWSFPINDETPPFPSNTYALSKQTGEIQLNYVATCYGVEGIAIRFPGMHGNKHHFIRPDWQPSPPNIRQAFSNLTYEDAARLVVSVVESSLPGFRIYFPSSYENRNGIPSSQILREFYPGIPCRRPINDDESLVDISRITRETGWKPQDRYRSS